MAINFIIYRLSANSLRDIAERSQIMVCRIKRRYGKDSRNSTLYNKFIWIVEEVWRKERDASYISENAKTKSSTTALTASSWFAKCLGYVLMQWNASTKNLSFFLIYISLSEIYRVDNEYHFAFISAPKF